MTDYDEQNKRLECNDSRNIGISANSGISTESINIAYYPYESWGNKYTAISQGILKECGCNITDFWNMPLEELSDIDAVILNWYDSTYQKWGIKALNDALKRLSKLKHAKKCGAKIIFTFHNRMPHNMKGILLPIVSKWLRKRICIASDFVIVVSTDSIRFLSEIMTEEDAFRKAFYIPHPNYVGVYTPPLEVNSYPNNPIFEILFIGAVKPYKNVELVIDVAKKLENYPIHFTVAGKCQEEYGRKLQKHASGALNITFDLRFIPDEELDCLIRDKDILLLPYDVRSSMNSGTVILAFSNGRSVICPEISTLKDFPAEKFYSYTYESEEEHLKKSTWAVLEAYHDWKYDNKAFKQKGTDLLDAVKRNNSAEVLKARYEELLERVI